MPLVCGTFYLVVRVEPGIRVSPQRGGGGGGGGGSEFFNLPTKNCFSFLSFSNIHCFRHPVRFQPGKSQKNGKNTGSTCSLASCLADYVPQLSGYTVLCTQKRYLATVTLIPGRCFRSRGRDIGFYNNRGEPDFSIFPGSLGPKGREWCGFQVDAPPPPPLLRRF